jgi:hypothetical protein
MDAMNACPVASSGALSVPMTFTSRSTQFSSFAKCAITPPPMFLLLCTENTNMSRQRLGFLMLLLLP